jgi:hypothetical protein
MKYRKVNKSRKTRRTKNTKRTRRTKTSKRTKRTKNSKRIRRTKNSKRTRKQKGGAFGYSLGLDSEPIGGLAEVKKYSNCPSADPTTASYFESLY